MRAWFATFRAWWLCLKQILRAKDLPSGLSKHVGDDERLARFLTSSKQFNSKMVKPAAFLPNPKNNQTSVFRHDGSPVEDLWLLGHAHISGGRSLHGAAILRARGVRAALLEVVSEEPPPRHANIIGWPTDSDPVLEKAKRKECAELIAQYAQLLRL